MTVKPKLRSLCGSLLTSWSWKWQTVAASVHWDDGDFGIAIEENATLVLVGTAIFGQRTPMRQRAQSGSAD